MLDAIPICFCLATSAALISIMLARVGNQCRHQDFIQSSPGSRALAGVLCRCLVRVATVHHNSNHSRQRCPFYLSAMWLRMFHNRRRTQTTDLCWYLFVVLSIHINSLFLHTSGLNFVRGRKSSDILGSRGATRGCVCENHHLHGLCWRARSPCWALPSGRDGRRLKLKHGGRPIPG